MILISYNQIGVLEIIYLNLHLIFSSIDMKYFFLFVSFIAVQTSFAQNYPEKLPAFEILTLDGETFSQEDIEKNTYNFFVYFNPTCGHCVDAFTFLNLKAEQIKNAEVHVYPVSSNTEELTLKFFEKHAPKIKDLKNLHVLKDVDYKFADTFDVGAFPASYLYDQDNNLVKVFEGASEVLFFLKEIE